MNWGKYMYRQLYFIPFPNYPGRPPFYPPYQPPRPPHHGGGHHGGGHHGGGHHGGGHHGGGNQPPHGGGGQHGGGGSQMPPGPPPSEIPKKDAGGPSLKAVDPGAISGCMYRYVYIWQTNGYGYWAWLTYVGRKSIAGYRWIGYRWVYFGTDLRNIETFYCY